MTQVGEQVTEALVRINQLLEPDNQRLVLQTVSNLRDLTAGLNARLKAVDQVLASSRSAAESIDAGAQQLGQAGERMATVAERSGARLDAAAAQAEQALAEGRVALAKAVTSLDAMERQLGSSGKRLELAAESLDDQIGAAVGELRSGLESATRTLEKLRDPRAALVGPGRGQLGPGESKP